MNSPPGERCFLCLTTTGYHPQNHHLSRSFFFFFFFYVHTAPLHKTAKVRLYYTGWSSSTGEADWALRPLFSTEAWAPKLNNMSFYSNDVVDGGIAKALVSTDDNEQAALYKSVQEQLMKDLPRIPLVTEENLSAHSKRLSGVYVMPDANINIDEITLK